MAAVYSIGTAIERFLYKLVSQKYISGKDREQILNVFKMYGIDLKTINYDFLKMIEKFEIILKKVNDFGLGHLTEIRRQSNFSTGKISTVLIMEDYCDRNYNLDSMESIRIQVAVTFILKNCK